MMDWIKKVKAVIFDLDGTLYQDYTFLGRYIQHMLKEQLSKSELEQVILEAYSILEGSHPIRIGYYYNRENQKVYAHENLNPTACFSWDGEEHEEVMEERKNLFYLGDPWGIAGLYAEKYNVDKSSKMMAFDLVRKEMLCEPNKIYRHQALFVAISDLNVERKVFMTNTPGPSGLEFLKYLEIERHFDEYIFDAKKPVGMQQMMEILLAEGYQPDEILSVGDNPFNDLYPVKNLGGRTCLISRYSHADSTKWDVKVQTIEDLTAFLRQLCSHSLDESKEDSLRDEITIIH
ncbi:HAD family hydrolase [Cytobacillus depressus]|uniref:HAD family hydrolase n=1 Tax=Cytobacillus depressus TaxID=1602942 RepID=A0A6L3V3G6_9BACI|nr:HAD family hydrolase [Cytobacillus depressus]KAB2332150.1 HAD family hydrolase [Cytobacillus depressus]